MCNTGPSNSPAHTGARENDNTRTESSELLKSQYQSCMAKIHQRSSSGDTDEDDCEDHKAFHTHQDEPDECDDEGPKIAQKLCRSHSKVAQQSFKRHRNVVQKSIAAGIRD